MSYPENFDVYLGLEEAAASLAWYEPELVPGLLQTEDYARAVISAGKPGTDAEEIDRRVQLRIERQVLIRRPHVPLELRVAVNESILRRQVGGREVMAGQLDALADVAGLPNVRLRVVPFSAGLHHGMHDRAVRHPAVPGQRRRHRLRAAHGLRGRLHRRPLPG